MKSAPVGFPKHFPKDHGTGAGQAATKGLSYSPLEMSFSAGSVFPYRTLGSVGQAETPVVPPLKKIKSHMSISQLHPYCNLSDSSQGCWAWPGRTRLPFKERDPNPFKKKKNVARQTA